MMVYSILDHLKYRLPFSLYRSLYKMGLIVFVFFMVACDGTARANTPVRFVYNVKPLPPFQLGEGTLIDWQHPGITLELLKRVSERLDIPFIFQRTPYKRMLYLLENNVVDAAFNASYKPEREKIGVYPRKAGWPDTRRALVSYAYHLYVPKGSLIFWDGDKIHNLNGTVGAITGYSIISDLKKQGVTVESEADVDINFNKMNHGRLAASAELEVMADTLRRQNPARYGDIIKLMPPLKVKPNYLLFSHRFYQQNKALAEKIWNDIVIVKEDPQFKQAMQKRYGYALREPY
ncbi:substrate-binding periplasmic protein [Magnetococcales bacterium HHB-1]